LRFVRYRQLGRGGWFDPGIFEFRPNPSKIRWAPARRRDSHGGPKSGASWHTGPGHGGSRSAPSAAARLPGPRPWWDRPVPQRGGAVARRPGEAASNAPSLPADDLAAACLLPSQIKVAASNAASPAADELAAGCLLPGQIKLLSLSCSPYPSPAEPWLRGCFLCFFCFHPLPHSSLIESGLSILMQAIRLDEILAKSCSLPIHESN